MTFEEDFPRLNYYPDGKHLIRRIKSESIPHARLHTSGSELKHIVNNKNTDEINLEEVVFIPKVDLKKHCLDKQKVRDAINKYIPCSNIEKHYSECGCVGCKLWKELKL